MTDEASGVTASGFFKLGQDTSISTSLDLRRQPMQKPQEKYLKYILATKPDWSWGLPLERIAKLRETFTQGVRSIALNITHALSDSSKLEASLSLLSGLDRGHASSDASAASSPHEVYYRVVFTRKNWFKIGDHSKLELHHKIADAITKSKAFMDAKYLISRSWAIKPALDAALINDETLDSSRKTVAPGLKMEYKPDTDHQVEIQAGGTWEIDTSQDNNNDELSYYFKVAYQAKF
jgi:hypothetical protein